MKKPHTLPAFTKEQLARVQIRLATTVAFMMGRKFEEDDWGKIYCEVKGIPRKGWSNLNIDVMYNGLAVEHKMLGRPPDSKMKDWCGTTLMHPAATRSIRIPERETNPNRAMHDILTQYHEFIEHRKRRVQESCPGKCLDVRTGWLLWQSSLREFLYFEEEMVAPNPADYFAEWKESGGGTRKKSKNLWVYEKETGKKRFSITTAAGAKIQPYFDVPPPNDPNLYIFKVQGEEVEPGIIRIWVSPSTERELSSLLGDLSCERISEVITKLSAERARSGEVAVIESEDARALLLSKAAYEALLASFPGVSDEHAVQLLTGALRSAK